MISNSIIQDPIDIDKAKVRVKSIKFVNRNQAKRHGLYHHNIYW